MIDKIKQLIIDKIRLIDPISKYGTTLAIRQAADKNIKELYSIADSSLPLDDFIKTHKTELIECCSYLCYKLSKESRTLPSDILRKESKKEADRILEIWKYIESK